MEYKIFLTVFMTIFLAELGDKTQLATLLFATGKEVSKLTVFLGSSFALVMSSGIGVLAGGVVSRYMSEKQLSVMAGICFIIIGIWTLIRS